MSILTLLKAGIKKQIFSVIGVLALVSIISLSICISLAVFINSGNYVDTEMKRLRFGDLTAWVGGADIDLLADELSGVNEVEKVGVQRLIFADYVIDGKQSDNQGQLIVHDNSTYPYHFLSHSMSGYIDSPEIADGEIYLSPALKSSYSVDIGSEIHFVTSRTGSVVNFKVAGFFEDPFMGSSMIDMKGFLINQNDFSRITQSLTSMPEYDVSAKSGAMLHIFQSDTSNLDSAEFNRILNDSTSLGTHTEFVYNDTSIYGFMLILQNIFTGILLVFVLTLTIVAMIVMGHSITTAIEQDYKNMGILKTVGFTSGKLKVVQLMQYTFGILFGMVIGLALSIPIIRLISSFMITSTGVLMPSALPLIWCFASFVLVFLVLALFIVWKANAISKVTPLKAILGLSVEKTKRDTNALRQNGLSARLALRSVLSWKKRYIGTCVIAVLLVSILGVVGKMNAWVGGNGEGLMNSFSVANHDLGVQPTTNLDMNEIEAIITSHSTIVDKYELAMQNVAVNGVDYTANAIDEPERFHILSGETSDDDNEIVVTEFVANELGLKIGDSVTVASGGRSFEYVVSGIYQCANEMGGNIGMSRDGYAKIGDINSFIWCHHYILDDGMVNETVMQELQNTYRGSLQTHTNSWSGLDGIVDTLHLLTAFMYLIVAVFMLVVMLLTGSKLLYGEQTEMAILRSFGFSATQLRVSFALRFAIVVGIGSVVGVLLSEFFADSLIGMLLKLFGVGEFFSGFSVIGSVLPPLATTVLFTAFAFFTSSRIRRIDCGLLIE